MREDMYSVAEEREQKLLAKIAKAKNDLIQLRQRRQLEIGQLAYQYGLHQWSNADLCAAFQSLIEKVVCHEE